MQRAVLVTGASRGLGLELIRQLGRAERPPRYLFAACRDPEGARGRDLKNFAKCFSNIKIVKMDLDDFDSIQESAEEIQKALLPALLQAAQLSDEPGFSSKKAAVINMSSIMASMELFNIQHGKTYAYRISKAALNMVTKCLANELKPHGILCASVHPGWVRTDMGGEKAPLTKEESVQGILKVLSRLSEQDNGLFLDWRGQLLPW
ncbi:C-factor-like isoform X2 [Pristis pectinata]|uniref:C-factor-like isoform X2 n=1 Tax=Pristis pectinata TaxID=685728 RepID=UPI00223DF24E|nr:C-factor-like isoform X2 [Pristis pectinata]